jgi:hypothetical protein
VRLSKSPNQGPNNTVTGNNILIGTNAYECQGGNHDLSYKLEQDLK